MTPAQFWHQNINTEMVNFIFSTKSQMLNILDFLGCKFFVAITEMDRHGCTLIQLHSLSLKFECHAFLIPLIFWLSMPELLFLEMHFLPYIVSYISFLCSVFPAWMLFLLCSDPMLGCLLAPWMPSWACSDSEISHQALALQRCLLPPSGHLPATGHLDMQYPPHLAWTDTHAGPVPIPWGYPPHST